MSTTKTAVSTTPITKLFYCTPEAAQWWVRLVSFAPDLADAIAAVDIVRGVLSGEQATEAIWLTPKGGYGPAWVHITDTPPSATGLRTIALGAAYSLRIDNAHNLATFLGAASEDRTGKFGQLLHAAAQASVSWSIAEAESRLAMTLGQAYARVGVIPLWANISTLEGHSGRREYRPREPELVMTIEPQEFILNCLEGVADSDPHWWYYAHLLFPEILA